MTHPYATRRYAETLADAAQAIREVPEWKLWVLRRPVEHPDFPGVEDAAGCYPVAVFGEDVDIDGGLARLRDSGLVSVVLVADPVLRPPDSVLGESFDVCRAFKTHYLHDSRRGPPRYSKHHRYELRRARAEARPIDLADYLPAWVALYEGLVEDRDIRGPAVFSPDAFLGLAGIEGLVSFGAFVGEELVACHHWFRDGAHVHSHLAASNATGYAAGAAYRLYDAAINYFEDAETIDFGGAAGLRVDPNDGLARFKRGFSNHSMPAYLCGKILDPVRYREICAARGPSEGCYFPAYRAPGQAKGERQ